MISLTRIVKIRNDNLKKIISILFLFGCAAAKQGAVTAVKAAKDCDYLQDYADDASDALMQKDYNLALNIAGAAYMKTLETPGTPCLKDAKDLTKQVTDFIIEASNPHE